MHVKEIMTKNFVVGHLSTTLKQAASDMQKNDFGFLPIEDHDRLVGVITDRDIITRAIASGLNPDEATVEKVMTKKVLYCFEDDNVKSVAKNMGENRIHRLLVLNKKKRLTGVVSLGDIATKLQNDKLTGDILEKISKH